MKRLVSFFVLLCLLFSFAASGTSAAIEKEDAYRDVFGHTGEQAVAKWSSYGILTGSNGFFRPDDSITGDEFASAMTMLVGCAPVTGARIPDALVTREEAADTIAQTFELAETSEILSFLGADADPNQYITRAEFLVILDSLFAGYYTSPGVYSGSLRGNALVRVPNVTFRDVWIDGDVYIAEGVGDGFYTIADSAIIDGRVIVHGGRPNPYPYIDPSAPMIAFTFDDGPSDATSTILDSLEQHGGRATFCVVGYLINRYADTIKRAVEQGSEIASHTLNHYSITTMTSGALSWDCEKMSDAIYEVAGVRPVFLRPPYGSYNAAAGTVLKDSGMSALLWSVDPRDWSNRNANTTYNNVMRNIKDGAIICMHDSVSSTATAMERLIPDLIGQGYQLVTVSELLMYSGADVQPGRAYLSRDSYK